MTGTHSAPNVVPSATCGQSVAMDVESTSPERLDPATTTVDVELPPLSLHDFLR